MIKNPVQSFTLLTFRHLPLLFLLPILLLSSCSGLADSPRQATQTAREGLTASATPTRLRSLAATPTGTPPAPTTTPVARDNNPTLTLWVNEKSAEHGELLAGIANDFSAKYDIHLEVIQVAPNLLPGLIDTAVISGTLPDLVFHPLEYTMGWRSRGILDATAATEAITQLDPETFDPAALELVTEDGLVTAVPSDGYKQLIIYRTDWFEQEGLAPPNSYENMLTAASTLYYTPTLTAGIVVPTESNLVTTQHVFEQMATANGCRLVDSQGEVLILHPACLEALDFYRQIVNQYSPSDVQTDISTLNAYLAGRAGLIVASPSVLPQLGGLDPLFPPRCPDCESDDFLARRSGIVTELAGGDGDFATSASFGEVNYLGITSAANTEAAVAFVDFWFNESYIDWLAVEAARKVPLRRGTPDQPRRFIDTWGTLPLIPDGPSLSDLYGAEVIGQLSEGVATSDRWGFREGQGELVTATYRELTFSILLQEMLSGYFTSSQTVIEAYKRVTALIPNYAYYPTPEPAPEG